uniref:Uncharacterized protein n=1 Tax=Ditylenchus dipsaci TaxID=166011 RepID=A0A915E621_9BILA
MWESTTFHLFFSIFLHIIGICTGLWIWYLFPQNPTKNVTRIPTKMVQKEALLRMESMGSESENSQDEALENSGLLERSYKIFLRPRPPGDLVNKQKNEDL